MNQFREIAEWDWMVTPTGSRLHHLLGCDWDKAQREWIVDRGIASCGSARGLFAIPGIATRIVLRRCASCCKKLAFPPGIGSPKNSDECRPLVEAMLAKIERESA